MSPVSSGAPIAQKMLDEIAAAAASILSAVTGAAVRPTGTELIREGGRNLVVRCGMEDAPDGSRSVIAKQFLPGQDLGFTDWACLRFLLGVPGADHLAPVVLGGDAERRLFLMQDLRDTLGASQDRTLDDELRYGTPVTVTRAAIAVAQVTARLHAATLGTHWERAFLRACGGLPKTEVHQRDAEAKRWVAHLPKAVAWLHAVGGETPAGFLECTQRIAATYSDPGPWLAFTHGDPAPTNTYLEPTGAAARLLDFEYGGYRHALYDITAWWVLCPLPETLERTLRHAYRDTLRAALTEALPTAFDDVGFQKEWATLVAYRALAILSWVPLTALKEDHVRVDEWTARQSLIATAERLHAATTAVPQLSAMAAFATILTRGLRARWPECAQRDMVPRWGYQGNLDNLDRSGGLR